MFSAKEIETLNENRGFADSVVKFVTVDTGAVQFKAIYEVYQTQVGKLCLSCSAKDIANALKNLYTMADQQIALQNLAKDVYNIKEFPNYKLFKPDLELAHRTYKILFDKEVPNRYKNNLEWITNKNNN